MPLFIILCLLISCSVFAAENLPLHLLKLPKGFSITVFADVPGAREMALGDKGTIFVGTIGEGKVYAVIPGDMHNTKTKVLTLASGLTMPNGVAFYKGALYVAEMDRIIRFDNIESHLDNPPTPVVVTNVLPKKKHHGWRYIKFSPEGKLYIGIGAPCNGCLSNESQFATIMRMNPDGSDMEVFAKGIRNTVGFDWDPQTHQLWFTDNGRDLMGDELPAEELNHATQANLHFGFPYCHGKNIPDPEYGKDFPCSAFVPPALEMPAHVAPLGITFYSGNMFPESYDHQIFIAEHGSWNRSHKIGYQVISVKLNDNQVVDAQPFISGWLQNEKPWGRPVDVLVRPNGALLVSDDHAGVIYQVTYQSPKKLEPA